MIANELLRLEERITIGIDIGESHFREFKSACQQDVNGELTPRDIKELCRDISEVLVSFTNADGGELFIGVEDDGRITGIPHKDELVALMKRSYMQYVHTETPLPTPTVGLICLEEKQVLYFSVEKSWSSVHLTSDGRCMQRLDRQNRPVPFEKILASREEAVSREYDRVFVDGLTTNDLDINLLDYVAERIAPGFSPEKLLQYLGLAEYGSTGLRYRKAAALLFAKDVDKWHPRCQVRIVRIRGTELGVGAEYNVVQDDLLQAPVSKIIDEVWDALRPHLARTRFESTGLFRESVIYPESACREALVNAVAHRDYSREGSAVEILVYDDRMEFRSPGGLLSGISLEELTNLARVHETRNVLIARSLRELGFMREMGEGILRMFDAMRESELVDPELTSDREHFAVTLRYQSIFNRQDLEWLEGYREFDLTKNEQRVVLLGRDGHLLSTNEIIGVTGIVDIDDFRALYEQLRRKGIVYNARPSSVGMGGKRREAGRFRVRPSSEAEQFLAELIGALKHVASDTSLTKERVSKLRSVLSGGSPYRNNPDQSLQALGFIDPQRRFLPKSLSYVPELKQADNRATARELKGAVKALRAGGYGFIRAESGEEFFFHMSDLDTSLRWEALEVGLRVTFVPLASRSSGRLDVASHVKNVR